MNELVLLFALLVIVIAIQFLVRRLPRPHLWYVRLVSVFLFALFVWFFADEVKTEPKIFFTCVLAGIAIQNLLDLVKYNKLHRS